MLSNYAQTLEIISSLEMGPGSIKTLKRLNGLASSAFQAEGEA